MWHATIAMLAICTVTACAYYAPTRNGEYSAPAVAQPSYGSGQPVYDASECVGPIVMGECQGQIVPNSAYHPKCYGQMLNGVCTGPMF